MKKTWLSLFVLTIVLTLVTGLVSCGEKYHVHNYDLKNTDIAYLASASDCNNSARYFYSCRCGSVGTETFEHGAANGHDTQDGFCTVCEAQESSYGLSFKLNEDESGYIITSIGSCTDSNIIIGTYNNMNVTRIDANAFINCGSITNVTIEGRVTTIGYQAFLGCDNLVSVLMKEGIEYISSAAFLNCKNLVELNIPNGVEYIGNSAFHSCDGLTSVYIPTSVVKIEEDSFAYCSNLSSFEVNEENTSYKSIDGNLYTKDGKTLMYYAVGKKETAFYIPDNVENIGTCTFYGSKLESVTLGKEVSHMNRRAFFACRNLMNIYTVESNSSYKSIDGNLYSKDGSTFVAYVFNKTDTNFNIPYGVTNIAEEAFCWSHNLKGVNFPNSVISIGEAAFSQSAIENITIPDGVTTISNYLFHSCYMLDSVNMGSGVTTIDEAAFIFCNKLTSITIPSGVTAISASAFKDCAALTNVTFENPEGWYVYEKSHEGNKTDVSSSCLVDPLKAANCLKSEYSAYCWKRN